MFEIRTGFSRSGLFAMLFCVAACNETAAADVCCESPSSEDSTAVVSLVDPAFDQHVDMRSLLIGFARLQPVALADAGLQLAEGERILLRPHKCVSADEILQLAVDVAAEKRDLTTLDRLSKAFIRDGRTELAARVQQAKVLASTSRTVHPATLVDAAATDLEVYRWFRGCELAIDRSRLSRDSKALELIQQAIDARSDVSHDQKQYLSEKCRDASAQSADSSPNSLGQRMHMLLAAARFCDLAVPLHCGL